MKNILEATRLTRAGRLHEATALLRCDTQAADGGLAAQGAQTGLASLATRLMQSLAKRSPHASESEAAPKMQALLRPQLLKRTGEGFSPRSKTPDALPDEARFETRRISHANATRAYKVYIPASYGDRAAALVVMLHGCSQSADDFAAGTRMNEWAEIERCIVVYPEQTQTANVSRCWNWFQPDHQERDRGEPGLIAAITREVTNDFAIDRTRVYVAGLSAGGAAAAIMASNYPDLYAAACVHSGLACGAARDMPSAFAAMRDGAVFANPGARSDTNCVRIPTIVFHGDSDRTVHSVNGDQVISQYSPDTPLRENVTKGVTAAGVAYTRTVSSDQSGRSMLELWAIHGAGHAWSGGSASGSFTDPRGPDASAEMLRFFREHRNATLRVPA